MFAIIDIETTGGNHTYDRITDICIILHDGLTVTEKFSSLVNPERNIPSHITRLTGISNEMVQDAPKFWEIAKRIIELTKGRVFVAHNVTFDYGFLQKEFSSLGYDYKREKLCTVRLSRKLLPGYKSYSLGVLCEQIGVKIKNRHRAEGDAEATAELFDLLLQKKAIHPELNRAGLEDLNLTKVDKIKVYILNKLPETIGVYYFLDKTGRIIYIGKSNNMRRRALSHFANKKTRSQKMLWELMDVDFIETGSEVIALLKEAEEIKKHKPKFNRARKKEVFTHSLEWFKDGNGILNLKVNAYEKSDKRLVSFTSYSSARKKMEELLDRYDLCLRYCGLTTTETTCFHNQLKKCRGICAGDEPAGVYNQRVEAVLKELLYPELNFVCIDKGRLVSEKSFVIVEEGRFQGFGYLEDSESIFSYEDLKSKTLKFEYFPDMDTLLKSWIKSNQKRINLKKMITPVNQKWALED